VITVKHLFLHYRHGLASTVGDLGQPDTVDKIDK